MKFWKSFWNLTSIILMNILGNGKPMEVINILFHQCVFILFLKKYDLKDKNPRILEFWILIWKLARINLMDILGNRKPIEVINIYFTSLSEYVFIVISF